MGKILPGVFLTFENTKGGVGKSTITALFAGYIHATAKNTGLTIGVVDIDDAQNTIGKMREVEKTQSENINEEYDIMSISSTEFIEQMDFLREQFDIILVDFPGNLKQPGVVQTLMMMDILIIPFSPSQVDIQATLSFYNFYKLNILSAREKNGFKTIVRGLLNRVVPNMLEFKELLASQDQIPFKMMNNYLKEQRVKFQRNMTNIRTDYDNGCDEFGEEVLSIITEYIKSNN